VSFDICAGKLRYSGVFILTLEGMRCIETSVQCDVEFGY